jgi:hypothetical protein
MVSLEAAQRIWYAVNLMVLICAAWILFHSIGQLTIRHFILILLIIFLLPPFYNTLLLGQVNLILLLLITGAIWASRKPSPAPVLAGIFIGIAASIKLFPIALGFIFLSYRRISALFLTVISGVSMTVLLSLILTGWENTRMYLFNKLPDLLMNMTNYPSNQSVRAVMARLFSENVFSFPVISADHGITVRVKPILNAPAFGWVLGSAGALVVLMVTILMIVKRSRDHPERSSLLWDFALLTTALLLASPLIWDHYYVLLLIPAVALHNSAYFSSRRIRLLLMAALLCIVLQRYWTRFTLYFVSPVLMMFGFLGIFLLWITLVYLTTQEDFS